MKRADAGAAFRSHLGSILKAVSWRATAGVDTFVVSYLVTGSIKGATSIAALELMTKIVLFWAHERAWLRLERRDWSGMRRLFPLGRRQSAEAPEPASTARRPSGRRYRLRGIHYSAPCADRLASSARPRLHVVSR